LPRGREFWRRICVSANLVEEDKDSLDGLGFKLMRSTLLIGGSDRCSRYRTRRSKSVPALMIVNQKWLRPLCTNIWWCFARSGADPGLSAESETGW